MKGKKGYSLQKMADREESSLRGAVKGAWKRGMKKRVDNSPLPSLLKKSKEVTNG